MISQKILEELKAEYLAKFDEFVTGKNEDGVDVVKKMAVHAILAKLSLLDWLLWKTKQEELSKRKSA